MTQVKICGLSTLDTLEHAIKRGADMVGLVFYPPSPRNVSMAQAAMLANAARGRTKIVALVVDADDELIKEISRRVRPDFFQVQGKESPERVAEIKSSTGIPVIKAVLVSELADVAAAQSYQDQAEMILFEAKAPANLEGALPGGNGIAFDWKLLAGQKGFMLSGGLNPDTVANAIQATGAACVDVSSGVESSRGVKDKTLISKFIEAAKSAR